VVVVDPTQVVVADLTQVVVVDSTQVVVVDPTQVVVADPTQVVVIDPTQALKTNPIQAAENRLSIEAAKSRKPKKDPIILKQERNGTQKSPPSLLFKQKKTKSRSKE
jgi:hypothetical protein